MKYHAIFYDYMPGIYQLVKDKSFIPPDIPEGTRPYLRWLYRDGYLTCVGLHIDKKPYRIYQIATRYLDYLDELSKNQE